MKLSEAFELAKVNMAVCWQDWQATAMPRFVCHALNRARTRDRISIAEYHLAREHVIRLLEGHSCLEQWLKHERGIDTHREATGEADHTDRMLKTRHAWLDSIIADLQTQGR